MRAAGTPVISLGPRRRVVGDRGGGLLEAGGVVVDEVVVEPVAVDQHVEHRAEQRRVGAGPQAEEQVGGAGQRRDPRVGTMSFAPRSRARQM